MAEKKIIEIEVPIGDAIQTIDQLTNKINELKAAEGLEGKQRVQNELKIKEYTRQRRVLMNEVGNEIKSTQQAMGAYQKLQVEYSKAAQKAKDLAVSQKAGSKEAREAAAAANVLSERLKAADATVGQFNRNVGDYKNQLAGLTSQMGMMPGVLGSVSNSVGRLGAAFKALLLNPVILAISAIVGAGAAMVSLVKNSMEFERQLSKVKAVTGATTEQMEALKNKAKEVGRTTLKTATEVAQLEFELSKLGFTVPQILAMTSAITDLSIATDASMARTSEVLGSTMRSIGLTAADATHVADVMAKSFSSSALDMEKWAESFKYVGAVAKTTGTSLEETSAMLAVLANNGISGSNAGTALRMIMLKLGEQSGTLTEKITKLQKEGLGLADANDEVGQRAMTALLILAQQNKLLPELTESFKNSTGAVREMSKIMQDNLIGDITILKSAWDGLMKSIEDGNGILSRSARSLTQWLSKSVSNLTLLNLSDDEKAQKRLDIFTKQKVDKYEEYLKSVSPEKRVQEINKEINAEKELSKQYQSQIDNYKAQIVEGKYLSDSQIKRNKEIREEINILNLWKNVSNGYINSLGGMRAASTATTNVVTTNAKLTDEQLKKIEEERKKQEEAIKKINDLIEKTDADLYKNLLKKQDDYISEAIKKHETLLKLTTDIEKSIRVQLNQILQFEIDEDDAAIRRIVDNRRNYLSDKLDIARLSRQGEADAQLEIMRWQMQQELSVKDLTEQQKLAITKKYKLQEQKLNETIIMNNVSMLGSVLGDISGLLEEGSKEQKAISSAQVAVDTITAAFAAFKSGVASGLPTPFNFIAGGTLAAIASAKGAKAIKDIWAVDEKGTTTAPAISTTASVPDLTSKMSSPLNRGVSNVAAMGGANVITSAPSTGSTLLNYDAMANAMTSAMSKMPAPVVSVVELNKKSNNVKFIENISTYSRK